MCKGVTQLGLPSVHSIRRYFGTYGNACVVAFGEAGLIYGYRVDMEEDTRKAIEEWKQGKTLTELGRTRGISGQALGRRIAKYLNREAKAKGWARHPLLAEIQRTRRRVPRSTPGPPKRTSEVKVATKGAER
jgi:hypothetical protein